jgi:AraC family transcriptional regulator
MFLRLQTIPPKKLIGNCLRMSFSDNRTFELWKSFMPRRNQITDRVNDELISMQIYPAGFDFGHFNPIIEFDKWAAVEVYDFEHQPQELHNFTIPGGLYAIFKHKGTPADAPKTFGYIFGNWLPQSDYSIDSRPHFEVLGEKYKNDSPDSEEEIWIPVRRNKHHE